MCHDFPVLGGRSLKLATVAGIRIGVDLSWFLILFILIFNLTDLYGLVSPDLAFVLATASALLFFGSVLLHELGHAIVAVRNGIGIAGIDLWMFGGIARMRSDTPSAGVEFRVAAAGPAVTFILIVLCATAGLALGGPAGFEQALAFRRGTPPLEAVLGYLTYINTLVLLFNLLPGFPLDGGRIARAIVWRITGDRGKATRFAATLGRGLAFLLMAIGAIVIVLDPQGSLLFGGSLVIIGLIIGQGARAAIAQERVTSRIEGVRVSDVMDSEPVAIPGGMTLEQAHEEFFLRYRWPWFPVVDEAGRLLGLITNGEVERVDEERRPRTSVGSTVTPDGAGAVTVGADDSLLSLLDARGEGLRRLGALMAVDRDGVLRGVVTLQQVRRALAPSRPAG